VAKPSGNSAGSFDSASLRSGWQRKERNAGGERLSGERTRLACWRARPRDRELLSCVPNGTGIARNKRLFRRDAETRSPRRPLPRYSRSRVRCL